MRLQDAPAIRFGGSEPDRVYLNGKIIGDLVQRRNLLLNPVGNNTTWWDNNTPASAKYVTTGFSGSATSMRFEKMQTGGIRMAPRFAIADWVPSTQYVFRVLCRSSEAMGTVVPISLRPNSGSGSNAGPIVSVPIVAGIQEIIVTLSTSALPTATLPAVAIVPSSNSIGSTADFTGAHLELASTWTGVPFDGDTPNTPGKTTFWTGTSQQSASISREWTWH